MTALARRGQVVVVGAGWAGLACAQQLLAAGVGVTLLDAAPQAGGRARRLTLEWTNPAGMPCPITVDNGQHLMIGAYRATLAMLRQAQVDPDTVLKRVPMHLFAADGFALHRDSAGWPAWLQGLSPGWALLRARGLPWADKVWLIGTLARLRMAGWRSPPGCAHVSDWWQASGQSPRLIEALWRPLAIGMLNTPPEQGCAGTFLNVLGEVFGGSAAASDFLLPRGDLSTAVVDPVLAHLQVQGLDWRPRTAVRRIVRQEPDGAAPWTLEADHDTAVPAQAVVLAVPPPMAARLLADALPDTIITRLNGFQSLPITTVWCGWSRLGFPAVASHPPVVALRDDTARGWPAQWLFDRGRLGRWQVAGLVISDSRQALAAGGAALRTAVTNQLREELGLPAPEKMSVITDKRATFACTPHRPRLDVTELLPHCPGIWLAGDHVCPGYPATLEGAVRSGQQAARDLLAHLQSMP